MTENSKVRTLTNQQTLTDVETIMDVNVAKHEVLSSLSLFDKIMLALTLREVKFVTNSQRSVEVSIGWSLKIAINTIIAVISGLILGRLVSHFIFAKLA